MSGILLIHGGAEYGRRVLEREGRGYWSPALPAVLEKYGHVALETAGPEALADAERLARADVVLVARLPQEAWTANGPAPLLEASAPVLAEGPLPPVLEEHLGVESGAVLREEGSIMVTDPGLRAAAGEYGAPLGAVLSESRRQAVDRDPELDWTRLDVPISEELAAAWRRPGWDASAWTLRGDATVLCEWVSRSGPARHPAIVRKGLVAGCSFGLFGFLAQRHTVEPFEGSEWRTADRSIGLEVALLGLIDEMHRRRGVVRARVLPWPGGASWARTVRQEVTADLDAEGATELLAAHKAHGSRPTVYWAPSAGTEDGMRAVAAASSAELALLAERLWAARESEARGLEARAGVRPQGAAARGSSHCFRHQGAPNVLWSEREGLSYTELTGRSHAHPHRFATLESDGSVRLLDVVCLPASEGLQHYARDQARLQQAADFWHSVGGLWQLLAPPEPADALSALGSSNNGGAVALTAAEAASWWRRSHFEVRLRRVDPTTVEVAAERPVDGLALELLLPDGRRVTRCVDVGADPVRITEESGPSRLVTWDETRELFRRAMLRHHGGRLPGGSATLQDLVRSDARSEWLLSRLAELGGPSDLEGRTVVDAGCGFGGVALYLGWRTKPERVVAFDRSASYVAVGREVAEAAGLADVVTFGNADLRSLPQVPDGSADLILALGVLMYLQSAPDVARALREFARVLAPGGTLFVYQASRWQLRDPQTGRRLVHLLPAPLARRATGRDQFKRWISPAELRLQLRAAGFSDTRLAGSGDEGWHERGLRRLRDPYYAVAATRSARGARRARSSRPARPAPANRAPVEWAPLSDAFLSAMEGHYAARHGDDDLAARRVTLRTNTELVPRRGDLLLRCFDELLGLPSLEGLRVLEVGCGFGALAAYLCLAGRAAELVATDVDESYLAVARAGAAAGGIDDRLRFVRADMRDLAGVGDQAFDVLVANNSFIYLTSRADVDRALQAFRRVLTPGGGVLFYHANKWRAREPFTGDPLIHLLPRRLAGPVSRITGWQHNHGRVRLLSPPELRRRLRRRGFDVAATRGYTNPPSQVGFRRNFGTFYALAARRGE